MKCSVCVYICVCVCVHVDFLLFLPEIVNKVEYIPLCVQCRTVKSRNTVVDGITRRYVSWCSTSCHGDDAMANVRTNTLDMRLHLP